MDEENSLQEGNHEHPKANLVWMLTKQDITTQQGDKKKSTLWLLQEKLIRMCFFFLWSVFVAILWFCIGWMDRNKHRQCSLGVGYSHTSQLFFFFKVVALIQNILLYTVTWNIWNALMHSLPSYGSFYSHDSTSIWSWGWKKIKKGNTLLSGSWCSLPKWSK